MNNKVMIDEIELVYIFVYTVSGLAQYSTFMSYNFKSRKKCIVCLNWCGNLSVTKKKFYKLKE